MGEKRIDKSLNIRTTGIREWDWGEIHYNRCEPTPYKALDKLFENYKLDSLDSVVDFGCGRGRVMFYIHNRFKVPVTGIEANDKTFGEALKNKETYMAKVQHIKAPIRLKYGIAEKYKVKPEDNRFYFFNPFSIKIFRKVVKNILKSVEKTPRTVDLIIYYPTILYKQFLRKDTSFELINKVRIPGETDKREKFLIYRLRQENMEDGD